jgi:hypothetical protein
MTVIKFPQKLQSPPQRWQAAELQPLVSACEGSVSTGAASGWEIGTTEAGDPQLYLLGPAPDYECILSVSRLGRHYVIEDGQGRVLLELDNPTILAEQAMAVLRRHRSAIAARALVALCALRETFKERTEALLAEPMELLTHIAPQLSSLA